MDRNSDPDILSLDKINMMTARDPCKFPPFIFKEFAPPFSTDSFHY